MISAEEWINRLELMPHPEGGYYKETLRPDDKSVHHIAVYIFY